MNNLDNFLITLICFTELKAHDNTSMKFYRNIIFTSLLIMDCVLFVLFLQTSSLHQVFDIYKIKYFLIELQRLSTNQRSLFLMLSSHLTWRRQVGRQQTEQGEGPTGGCRRCTSGYYVKKGFTHTLWFHLDLGNKIQWFPNRRFKLILNLWNLTGRTNCDPYLIDCIFKILLILL